MGAAKQGLLASPGTSAGRQPSSSLRLFSCQPRHGPRRMAAAAALEVWLAGESPSTLLPLAGRPFLLLFSIFGRGGGWARPHRRPALQAVSGIKRGRSLSEEGALVSSLAWMKRRLPAAYMSGLCCVVGAAGAVAAGRCHKTLLGRLGMLSKGSWLAGRREEGPGKMQKVGLRGICPFLPVFQDSMEKEAKKPVLSHRILEVF